VACGVRHCRARAGLVARLSSRRCRHFPTALPPVELARRLGMKTDRPPCAVSRLKHQWVPHQSFRPPAGRQTLAALPASASYGNSTATPHCWFPVPKPSTPCSTSLMTLPSHHGSGLYQRELRLSYFDLLPALRSMASRSVFMSTTTASSSPISRAPPARLGAQFYDIPSTTHRRPGKAS